MNETESIQLAADVLPGTRCAISGLLHNRSEILKARLDLIENPSWRRFEEFWKFYNDEIKAIDARVDIMVANERITVAQLPKYYYPPK